MNPVVPAMRILLEGTADARGCVVVVVGGGGGGVEDVVVVVVGDSDYVSAAVDDRLAHPAIPLGVLVAASVHDCMYGSSSH